MANNKNEGLDVLARRWPLDEALYYFKCMLARDDFVNSVLIFGSSVKGEGKKREELRELECLGDIDYLIVGDNETDKPLRIWDVYFARRPSIEYNGRLSTDLDSKNMRDAWGNDASQIGIDFLEKLKEGKERCIVLSRDGNGFDHSVFPDCHSIDFNPLKYIDKSPYTFEN